MIVFATNNAHKLKEVRDILPHLNICSLKELNINIDPEENGSNYYENALIKAQAIREFTDIPILADDSGLEIEELPNELGLYTSRFHNELTQFERNKLVLKLLEGKTNRKAKFVCSALLLLKDKIYHYKYECKGTISLTIKDGDGGFGYDPIFIPNGYNDTFSSMKEEDKNKISHRGVAMRELMKLLKDEIL